MNSLRIAIPAAAGLAVIAVAISVRIGVRSTARTSEQVLSAYAKLPVTFVENRGQTDGRVRFYAQGPRHGFYLTREEIVFSFKKGTALEKPVAAEPAARGVALALQFLGSNPNVVLEGEERVPGAMNYLRGNDPAKWHTNLPSYRQVLYRQLWPGVDMSLRENAGTLKYEFRVRAGARVADIRLAYAGTTGLDLDRNGALRIKTALGALRDSPPVAYQEIAGSRVPLESRYVLEGEGYGFAVGDGYKADHDLIIDPGLEYSTFLGGSSHESGFAIAVDSGGNAYVTGFTQSPNFPTTSGAFDRTFNVDTCPRCGIDQQDVFVTKLNPSGSGLVYSTFLGGFQFDD